VFRVSDRPCPDARQRTAQDADDEATEEISQIECGTAGDLKDPPGTQERHEHEI
jgi:hypothetical protein